MARKRNQGARYDMYLLRRSNDRDDALIRVTQESCDVGTYHQ